MVFFNGNAICMFSQDKGTVEKLKQHYLVYIEEKKTPSATYTALEKAIEKVLQIESGKPQKVRLSFTQGQPTVWKVCKCPIGYHELFEECRGY